MLSAVGEAGSSCLPALSQMERHCEPAGPNTVTRVGPHTRGLSALETPTPEPEHTMESPTDFNRLCILPQISTHGMGRTSRKMCEIGSAKKAKISSPLTKIERCYSSHPSCFPSHSAHILSQVFEWCKSTYRHRSIRSHSNLHQQKKKIWL